MRLRFIDEEHCIVEFAALHKKIQQQVKGSVFTTGEILVEKGTTLALVESETPPGRADSLGYSGQDLETA